MLSCDSGLVIKNHPSVPALEAHAGTRVGLYVKRRENKRWPNEPTFGCHLNSLLQKTGYKEVKVSIIQMRDLEETLQGINLIHQLAHKVLISCQRWISLHVLIDASIEASGHEGIL